MDNSKIPSTIVECGFLSNPEECSLLQDDEYQNKLDVFTGDNSIFCNNSSAGASNGKFNVIFIRGKYIKKCKQ